MDWLSTAWLGLVVVPLFWLPGLPVAYLTGLRGITAWGSAPLLTGGIVGTAAVIAGAVGVPWSLWVVLAATAIACALAFAVVRLAGRWESPHVARGRPLRRRLGLWLTAAVLLAVPLQVKRLINAIGPVTHFPQTYDTLYHFNAVKEILQTHDASSLHMVLAMPPGTTTHYYPALWHDMASLIAQVAPHTSVVVIANWMTLVIACLIWPASMLVLTRFLFGPRPLPLALSLAFSFAFIQFPDLLTRFGILYPNLLSYAYLPALLGLTLLTLWRARGRRRLGPLLLAGVGALAVLWAQPNGLFALGYVLVPVLIHYCAHVGLRLRRRGRSWAVSLAPLVVLGVSFVGIYWASSQVALVQLFRSRVFWVALYTPAEAMRQYIELSTIHPQLRANFLLAILVGIGFVTALAISRWRWVPFGYAIIGVLCVIVASASDAVRSLFTGYWYGDPQRLGALIPLLGVPLAALGATVVARGLARLVPSSLAVGGLRSRTKNLAPALAGVLAVVAVVVVPRSAVYRDVFQLITNTYAVQSNSGLISKDELRLMPKIEKIVPEGEVVAGNPWSGAAMTWTLADREPLFPHVASGPQGRDQVLIAQHLGDARTDPAVCAALDHEDVHFAYTSDTYLWNNQASGFEALTPQVLDTVGVVVASDGGARLYKITACG